MSQPVILAILVAIVLAFVSLGAFVLMLTGNWLGEDGHDAAAYVAAGGTVVAMTLAGLAGRHSPGARRA